MDHFFLGGGDRLKARSNLRLLELDMGIDDSECLHKFGVFSRESIEFSRYQGRITSIVLAFAAQILDLILRLAGGSSADKERKTHPHSRDKPDVHRAQGAIRSIALVLHSLFIVTQTQ